MRVQIRLPDGAWEQLCDLAHRERRYPKQQAEFLILRALGWEVATPVPIDQQKSDAKHAVKEAIVS